MKFRDHPLLSCRGLRSWPPVWISGEAPGRERLYKEVETLLVTGCFDGKTPQNLTLARSARQCTKVL
jgi:hypothetical protein